MSIRIQSEQISSKRFRSDPEHAHLNSSSSNESISQVAESVLKKPVTSLYDEQGISLVDKAINCLKKSELLEAHILADQILKFHLITQQNAVMSHGSAQNIAIARLIKAEVFMLQNKPREAHEWVDQLLAKKPTLAKAQYVKARACLLDREFNQASQWADKLLTANRNSVWGHQIKAKVSLMQRLAEKTLRH